MYLDVTFHLYIYSLIISFFYDFNRFIQSTALKQFLGAVFNPIYLTCLISFFFKWRQLKFICQNRLTNGEFIVLLIQSMFFLALINFSK